MIAWIWIISLILLIAFAVFVYKMLITSSELLSTDKQLTSRLLRTNYRDKYLRQSLETLNAKMKSLEDGNAYYAMQFTRLQQQFGERSKPETGVQVNSTTPSLRREDEEDWEEMYYLENEAKVRLENELDALQQEMEVLEEKKSTSQVKTENLAALKSKYEGQLEEITALKIQLESVQKKLSASLKRERELDHLLQKEISQKKENLKILSENVSLKSESEDQRRQLMEMFKKEQEVSKNLERARELESKVAIYEEEERISMHKVEKRLKQNTMFTD